ncbi:MAG TPA: hypothetical protein VGN29_08880, partial [Solirubrobacteraceae bacterium]|nr:hypothetical protein [Solirubrobacteraceae bacterium]
RHGLVVYASWNGATDVSTWRVLGGATATALHPVATSRSTGFETSIATGRYAYIAVQALDAERHVLGQSATQGAG